MYLGHICKVLFCCKIANVIWFHLVFIDWDRFALIKQQTSFQLGDVFIEFFEF